MSRTIVPRCFDGEHSRFELVETVPHQFKLRFGVEPALG